MEREREKGGNRLRNKTHRVLRIVRLNVVVPSTTLPVLHTYDDVDLPPNIIRVQARESDWRESEKSCQRYKSTLTKGSCCCGAERRPRISFEPRKNVSEIFHCLAFDGCGAAGERLVDLSHLISSFVALSALLEKVFFTEPQKEEMLQAGQYFISEIHKYEIRASGHNSIFTAVYKTNNSYNLRI